MADNVEFSAFSKRELNRLAKVFNLMGDDAIAESRKVASEIAEEAKQEIKSAGYTRTKSAKVVQRIVDGASLSKTSKTGRLSYGFASQRFSGGATTQMLWGGMEFGTNNPKLRQFPTYSGSMGSGSTGWFIFPTLRKLQPKLTLQYIEAMNKVVKNWNQ